MENGIPKKCRKCSHLFLDVCRCSFYGMQVDGEIIEGKLKLIENCQFQSKRRRYFLCYADRTVDI